MEDTYKYKSTIVATYIAALANEKRVSVNMTKIQKLLYIAYGIYLAVKDSRLTNEHPQAWPYGPVFPTTRNKLQKGVDWQFTTDDARTKLKHLYPIILT